MKDFLKDDSLDNCEIYYILRNYVFRWLLLIALRVVTIFNIGVNHIAKNLSKYVWRIAFEWKLFSKSWVGIYALNNSNEKQ